MIPPCLFVEHTNLIYNSNQIQVLVSVENQCSDVQNANLRLNLINFGRTIETRVLDLGSLSPGQIHSQRVTLGPNTNNLVNNGLSRGHLTYCYGNEICSQTPNFLQISFSR